LLGYTKVLENIHRGPGKSWNFVKEVQSGNPVGDRRCLVNVKNLEVEAVICDWLVAAAVITGRLMMLEKTPCCSGCTHHGTVDDVGENSMLQSYLLLFGDHPLTLSLQA